MSPNFARFDLESLPRFYENDMTDAKSILVPLASTHPSQPRTKVSVIGVGSVGMAIAFSIMNKVTLNFSDE